MQVLNVNNLDLKALMSTKRGLSAMTTALVLASGIAGVAFTDSVASGGEIVSGVRYEGTSLVGLNESDAKTFFEGAAAEKIHPLTFTYGEQQFQITPEEIGLTPQIDNAVTEALKYGRGGTLFDNFGEQFSCWSKGRDIGLSAVYDEDLLNRKIDEIAAQIDTQPVNAVCYVDGNGVGKIPGVIGKKLNREQLAESLKMPLVNLNLPSDNIEIVPEDIAPFITTEDIAAVDTILGEYSTYYYPGDRGDNIWIAANAISDKIVKTGWEFSFNTTVGRRTYDAGYLNAGVIINGRPAVDVGGGVCQVSSTLYNAVLLAGLTPTERTPHYFQSSYIGTGRDATVADDQIDFKFRNDLPHPVYLTAYASGSTLTVFVLGTAADLDGANISIETEGSSMSPSVYRVYYKDGQVLKSEYLHTDVYHEPLPPEPTETQTNA